MKLSQPITILSIVLLTALLGSCYYDNDEELYPSLPDKNCDITDSTIVTYDTHISKIILEESCVSCHGANYVEKGGNYKLDNYEDVKNSMYEIMFAIKWNNPDFPPMPYESSKLSDCKIKQFEIWEKNGYPEK